MIDFAKAAAEDEKATARLQTTLKNLGGDFNALSGQVDSAIAAGQKLAFSDDDVRDSFQSLAVATGSAEEAFQRQQVAMDLARGAGIPLAAASKMVGKVTEENVDAFKRLGINIAEGATEAEALAAVQAKFAGQSKAYADSTAGQFEQAQLAMDEVKESLGSAILPILAAVGKALADNLPAIQAFVGALSEGIAAKVTPAMEALAPIIETIKNAIITLVGAVQGDWLPAAGIDPFSTAMGLLGLAIKGVADAIQVTIKFFQDNDAAMAVLVGVVSGLTVAYGLYTAAIIAQNLAAGAAALATGVMTAAQWLLNAALTANPIGIVVVALAALAGAVIYAYNNSEEFRKAVDTLWATIQVVFANIATAAGQMKDAVAAAFTAAQAAFATFKTNVEGVVTAVKGAIQGFFDAAMGWANAFKADFPGTLLALIGEINKLHTQFFNAAIALGGQIISGIISGVQDAASRMVAAVVKAVQDALNAAKAALPGGGGGAPAGGGGAPAGRALAPYVYVPPTVPAGMLRAGGGAAAMAPLWTVGGGGGRGAAAPPAARLDVAFSGRVEVSPTGDLAALADGLSGVLDDWGSQLTAALGEKVREVMR